MLKEFQEEIMNSEERKIDLSDQIIFEKDVLGYAITKFPSVDSSLFLVSEINKKFTPRVTLYRLCDGVELSYKVSKDKFYFDEYELFYKGDVVQLLEIESKNAWKMVDNKWVKNEDKTEEWIERCRIIRRNNG